MTMERLMGRGFGPHTGMTVDVEARRNELDDTVIAVEYHFLYPPPDYSEYTQRWWMHQTLRWRLMNFLHSLSSKQREYS